MAFCSNYRESSKYEYDQCFFPSYLRYVSCSIISDYLLKRSQITYRGFQKPKSSVQGSENIFLILSQAAVSINFHFAFDILKGQCRKIFDPRFKKNRSKPLGIWFPG
jgi:hypothetical protein